MISDSQFTALLKKEVQPALGCTAPVAVGIAAAKCRALIGGDPLFLRITVSPGIYKNGFSVGIPNSGEKGNLFGAALGLVHGNADLGLEVFNGVNQMHIQKAKSLLMQKIVELVCDTSQRGVYIRGDFTTTEGSSYAVMNTHSDIIEYGVNGSTEKITPKSSITNSRPSIDDFTIEDILHYAEHIDFKEICFLLDGVEMNKRLAQDGLDHTYGLCSGRAFKEAFASTINTDPIMKSRVLVSAASDARMGGSPYPAMSTVGSGNQGITAILPVAVFAESVQASKEKLAKALAISHLVTYYVKLYIGRISSMCLCGVAASTGASAAITWMKGGNVATIKASIRNILGGLTGMICDGAKGSCALKMGVAATEAFHASILSMAGSYAGSNDGIIDDDLVCTLKNADLITKATRDSIDDSIVQILNAKAAQEV